MLPADLNFEVSDQPGHQFRAQELAPSRPGLSQQLDDDSLADERVMQEQSSVQQITPATMVQTERPQEEEEEEKNGTRMASLIAGSALSSTTALSFPFSQQSAKTASPIVVDFQFWGRMPFVWTHFGDGAIGSRRAR